MKKGLKFTHSITALKEEITTTHEAQNEKFPVWNFKVQRNENCIVSYTE